MKTGMTTGITRRGFAAWLGIGAAGWARSADATAIALAREAAPDIDPAPYLVSEKYDGVRAVWDGRALVFRSGLPVAAPRWFIERLPDVALDGELWLGRGRFEALAALARRKQAVDAEWREVRYMVFELPGSAGSFAQRAQRIGSIVEGSRGPLVAVTQQRIATREALAARLSDVVRGGGEGLVLHRADAPYLTGRTDALLKLKPVQDADAVVIGHLPGAGKHTARLGALRVRSDDGHVFAIGTGFSDAEREHPPPIGTHITYAARGNTRHGVPRFASFLRVRDPF